MFGLPLHPIVVHFPIALAFLLPLLTLLIWFGVKKEAVRPRMWISVIALNGALFGFAWLAEYTGEMDEHKVEKIVGEEIMEDHEDWGKSVLWVSGIVFALSFAPLIAHRSEGARVIYLLGTLGTLLPVSFAAHSGGIMIYKHNAAQAHLEETLEPTPDYPPAPIQEQEDDSPQPLIQDPSANGESKSIKAPSQPEAEPTAPAKPSSPSGSTPKGSQSGSEGE